LALDGKKQKAIRLLVFTTKTKKEIAKELGITEQTLYNWLKDEEFNSFLRSETKLYLSYIRNFIFKKLNKLLIKSFDVIEKSLNSPSESVRVKSAFNILNVYSNFGSEGFFKIKNLNELSHLLEAGSEYYILDEDYEAKRFLENVNEEVLGFEDDFIQGVE
jgi:transcriptional regulator with XRE-family HTH domain